MQGWEEPEGLRGQAGEPAVLHDVPAEPAPGPRAGPDELVRDGVEYRESTPGRVTIVNPAGKPLAASHTRACHCATFPPWSAVDPMAL